MYSDKPFPLMKPCARSRDSHNCITSLNSAWREVMACVLPSRILPWESMCLEVQGFGEAEHFVFHNAKEKSHVPRSEHRTRSQDHGVWNNVLFPYRRKPKRFKMQGTNLNSSLIEGDTDLKGIFFRCRPHYDLYIVDKALVSFIEFKM